MYGMEQAVKCLSKSRKGVVRRDTQVGKVRLWGVIDAVEKGPPPSAHPPPPPPPPPRPVDLGYSGRLWGVVGG